MANKITSHATLLAAAAFLSGSLHAQTTFSDEQEFLNPDGLLPSYYNEDFSEFDDTDNSVFNDSVVFDGSGAANFSFTATTRSADGLTSPSGVIWFTQGQNYAGTGLSVLQPENEPIDRLLINGFTGGVDAIGARFFLTADAEPPDGDWIAGELTVTVTFSDNTSVTQVLSSEPNGEFEFFGVYAQEGLAISELQLVSNTANAYPTIGNITIGSQVPEPATVVLWSGLGVFALAVALRRRRRAA